MTPESKASNAIAAADILRWAHGGDGVALVDGRVVFVPDAVPGDVVALEVVEDRGRWARARVARLLVPSPERVTPPCPVQARCGGCPWMIGSVAAQAASREAILRGEVGKRLGAGVAVRMAPAPTAAEALGYRQRVRLTYRDGQLGYLGRASHELVDIPGCPIADPRIEARLPALRAELAAGRHGARGRVTLLAGEDGVAGWIEPEAGEGRAFGADAVTVAIGPYRQRLQARGFAQANARVTGAIVEAVADAAGDGVTAAGPRVAVELFAGSGTLTQALWSRGWEVHAYEGDAGARAAFEATRAALGGRGAWHACDLGGGLVRPAPPRAELVLLDPPRTGAAAVMPWVRASPATTVVYVSCDLATGLRDLATLTADGRWGVESVTGYDMFSHSGHQELVAVARRGFYDKPR